MHLYLVSDMQGHNFFSWGQWLSVENPEASRVIWEWFYCYVGTGHAVRQTDRLAYNSEAGTHVLQLYIAV
jgi:hypothetical protein